MTTDVLRLPGDYRIESKSSPSTSVTIDSPNTFITGDLTILGTMTNIVSTITNITDNILVLNSGEQNDYVTLGTSGILIARGNNDSYDNAATLLYNDNTSTGGLWNIGSTSTRGIFEFSVANRFSAIRADAIRIGASSDKLNIFGSDNPTAVLSVAGTYNYEEHVIDDDDIPNKKYVDSAKISEAETARKLQVGTSYVKLFSNGTVITDPYYSSDDKLIVSLVSDANIVFSLEGSVAKIQGLVIDNNTLMANTAGLDIVVDAVNTGTLFVKSPLTLLNSVKPQAVSNRTAVYSTSTVGGGGTGIYYVRPTDSDELVSRKRAIIYGIIF